MKATGNVCGNWKEYEETPTNHDTGYFWMRSDGLRCGLRLAGEYYRQGTKPGKIAKAGWASTGYAASDHCIVVPIENILESGKLEKLPTHIRVMRGDEEIELFTELDEVPVDCVKNADIFKYLDEKYPLNKKPADQRLIKKTERTFSVAKPKARRKKKNGK